MACQWLGSKWPAAKARRRSMSFATCDREATQAPAHFQLNPPGRSSLGEFPRRSLDQPRMLSGQRFARSLKFAQTPRGHCQAMPVAQHCYFDPGRRSQTLQWKAWKLNLAVSSETNIPPEMLHELRLQSMWQI
jgi:hypothetical protein